MPGGLTQRCRQRKGCKRQHISKGEEKRVGDGGGVSLFERKNRGGGRQGRVREPKGAATHTFKARMAATTRGLLTRRKNREKNIAGREGLECDWEELMAGVLSGTPKVS